MEKFTIQDFNAKYASDDVCLHEIFTNRYGSLKKCPSCKEETKFHKVTDRKCYACQWCGHQLHPLAGTIFHKSDTSLVKWFFAIFLFANSKNGVSGKELERQLGVTYKTAWRIAKQIRRLMKQAGDKIGGIVEADETYVGGVKRGKRGRGAGDKTVVFGVVARKGKIKAQVVPDVKAKTLIPLIQSNVHPGSILFTDEMKSYDKVSKFNYTHSRVRHLSRQYAYGPIHTNTIEGFWSQLKRSVNGTYHAVSPKHLQSYVDEFAYRYGLRDLPVSLFYPMIAQAGMPAL